MTASQPPCDGTEDRYSSPVDGRPWVQDQRFRPAASEARLFRAARTLIEDQEAMIRHLIDMLAQWNTGRAPGPMDLLHTDVLRVDVLTADARWNECVARFEAAEHSKARLLDGRLLPRLSEEYLR